MASDQLTSEVKARVPDHYKERLQREAARRHLKPADLIREALRKFLDKPQSGEPAIEEGK